MNTYNKGSELQKDVYSGPMCRKQLIHGKEIGTKRNFAKSMRLLFWEERRKPLTLKRFSIDHLPKKRAFDPALTLWLRHVCFNKG